MNGNAPTNAGRRDADEAPSFMRYDEELDEKRNRKGKVETKFHAGCQHGKKTKGHK